MASVVVEGGTSTVENQVTGQNHELRWDESNKEIRGHDGQTKGGWRFPNRDANDARYQVKSTELNGIAGMGLPDAARGFLTRIGAGTYTVRGVYGTDGEISVTNPTGEGGDAAVGLPDTISKSLTVTGLWTFTQAIDADVTGQALGGGSGDFTGSFTGDVDVSNGTMTMADGQIELSWLSQDILDYIAARAVPVGAIVAFAGSVASIPAGWGLCNGSNGTEDLRDRFIVGAGSTYAVNATGGATTHTHSASTGSAGAHTHTITVGSHALTIAEMPSHYHLCGQAYDANVVRTNWFAEGFENGGWTTAGREKEDVNTNKTTYQPRTDSRGSGNGHSHSGSSGSAGAHTHSVTVPSASNLPPYYAKAFIQKLAYS